MKTLVHLNERTQLTLNMSFEELEKAIEENHDKADNFILVDCIEAYYGNLVSSYDMKGKKFKLYIKRVLFFYEMDDETDG